MAWQKLDQLQPFIAPYSHRNAWANLHPFWTNLTPFSLYRPHAGVLRGGHLVLQRLEQRLTWEPRGRVQPPRRGHSFDAPPCIFPQWFYIQNTQGRVKMTPPPGTRRVHLGHGPLDHVRRLRARPAGDYGTEQVAIIDNPYIRYTAPWCNRFRRVRACPAARRRHPSHRAGLALAGPSAARRAMRTPRNCAWGPRMTYFCRPLWKIFLWPRWHSWGPESRAQARRPGCPRRTWTSWSPCCARRWV